MAAALAGLLALGDGIVVALLLAEILEDTASQRERRWFGHLASLEGILLASLLIGWIHGAAVRRARRVAGAESSEVAGILIGADNRLSTSKLSAFTWTWVLAWAMLSLAIADWVAAPAGWEAFLKQGLRAEYLILLGGPFVALVGAKALVGGAVSKGAMIKPAAAAGETKPADRVTQAFSDDTGQTDLVDTQYLLFGLVALVVFIVMFIRASASGLPQVPEVLIGLASVGATAYIANKWTAEDAKPQIDRIVPNSAKRGETITIYGTNLLSVSMGGKQVPAAEDLQVIYGGLGVQEVSPAAEGANRSAAGSDYIRIPVAPLPEPAPGAAAGGKVDISVRNALGVMSENTVEFTIVA